MFICDTCAQLILLAETPQPHPPLWALLVSQDRRHLFVTPWFYTADLERQI